MDKIEFLKIFLQALVYEAHSMGFSMRKIILIKYLYLLDVYMAQETGKKYTNFTWIFFRFGPWDVEVNDFIENMIQNKLIIAERHESKYKNSEEFVTLLPIKDSPDRKTLWNLKQLPLGVYHKIFIRDLDIFKDDVYKLLDYVYFDTEPMKNVNMNDILRFDNLQKDIPKASVSTGKISNTKAKLLRDKFTKQKTIKNKKKEYFPVLHDNLDAELERVFSVDDAISETFAGVAIIK